MALLSCEEAFVPEISDDDQIIIVEGHIEKGEDALPPYVILSRSLPFFGTIEPGDLEELQILDAEVRLHFQEEVYPLEQICLSDLPAEIRERLRDEIGLLPGGEAGDFCVYLDVAGAVPIVEQTDYRLEIDIPGEPLIEGQTRIPSHIPLDSHRFTRPPGMNENDTMARLLIYVSDPPGEENYYRYMTAGQGESMIAGFSSVTDDRLFDGQSFEFPLTKAVSPQRQEELDPDNFGLFRRGDTVRVKWMNIDEAHFQFWNTFEFNLNNQGPFSTYTRVRSNVSNATGVWGGYSSTTYEWVVPEE